MENDGRESSDELLMSCVCEFRCLYDKQLKDYKDQRKKMNAWKEISERVGMPVENCTKRYNNIRTQFAKYLKSLNPPSGSGRDTMVLKPEYEHLRWLICHIKHRETVSNFPRASEGQGYVVQVLQEAVDNHPNQSYSDSQQSISPNQTSPSLPEQHTDGYETNNEMQQDKGRSEMSPSPAGQTILEETDSGESSRKIRKRGWAKNKVVDVNATDKAIMQTMEELKSQKTTEAKIEDEDSLFCASLSMKMRRLSHYQKGVAQLKILQVLNDVEWSVGQSPTVNQHYTHLPYQPAVQPQQVLFQQHHQQPVHAPGHIFSRFTPVMQATQQSVPEEANEVLQPFTAQMQDSGS